MPLSPVEREKIADSLLEIQAVRSTLGEIEKSKVPNADEKPDADKPE